MNRDEFIAHMKYKHHYLQGEAEKVADVVDAYKMSYADAKMKIDYAMSVMEREAKNGQTG